MTSIRQVGLAFWKESHMNATFFTSLVPRTNPFAFALTSLGAVPPLPSGARGDVAQRAHISAPHLGFHRLTSVAVGTHIITQMPHMLMTSTLSGRTGQSWVQGAAGLGEHWRRWAEPPREPVPKQTAATAPCAPGAQRRLPGARAAVGLGPS